MLGESNLGQFSLKLGKHAWTLLLTCKPKVGLFTRAGQLPCHILVTNYNYSNYFSSKVHKIDHES
jgi:hypothetical protein